jgi:hypothetical protein
MRLVLVEWLDSQTLAMDGRWQSVEELEDAAAEGVAYRSVGWLFADAVARLVSRTVLPDRLDTANALRLQARSREYRAGLFAFFDRPDVPPTNTASEQDPRPPSSVASSPAATAPSPLPMSRPA